MLGLSGLLGLAAVLGVWRLVMHRHEAAAAQAGQSAETAPAEEAAAASKASPELIDCRWLPEQTICVLESPPVSDGAAVAKQRRRFPLATLAAVC